MPQSPPDDGRVREQYGSRLEQRQQESARWERIVRLLGTLRLAVFILFLVMAWGVTERHLLGGGWLWFPLLAFGVLVARHRIAFEALERARRAVAFYEEGLHRLADTWMGRGRRGERFADEHHAYASDLDLFGEGSLFELLDLARTAAGEERLASWLREPASPTLVRERQEAVRELAGALDLREEMATLTAERGAMDVPRLVAWGEGAQPGASSVAAPWVRVGSALLGGLTFAALVHWALGGEARPFGLLFGVECCLAWPWRARTWEIMRGLDRPRRDLRLLHQFVACLERQRFDSPLLGRISAQLHARGHVPSQRLRRLFLLMEYAEAWRNAFFAPFAIVLLWPLQFAGAIERWREVDGTRLRQWTDAVAEMEALLSLSAYAFENPGDVFPEILEEGPRFEGQGLGHPLIARAKAVRNDVHLGRDCRLLLVSGSNMAGKSSLLRTVGVNVVLSLAGAPARARALQLSPLAVGACMRVHDSLQQGVSHFYAEIRRLRQVVDLLGGELPLLFLLDEILHGTNSHDRRIGAEAVVRVLVEKGAVGLVTTHDLALTAIVGSLAPRARNVHFQDELVDGRVTFDYVLRDGVVERSNAIALMRAVGLEVGP